MILRIIIIVIMAPWFALLANPILAHVVPEDELRNQIYLTKIQALKGSFKGAKNIQHLKKRLSQPQRDKVKIMCGHEMKARRADFYVGDLPDGQRLYAFMDNAEANSHPPTKALFIVVLDNSGKVLDIKIVEYRGPQRSEIISDKFLDQFKGKSAESDFSAITSNQGSTPTIRAMIQSVHKITALFRVLELET